MTTTYRWQPDQWVTPAGGGSIFGEDDTRPLLAVRGGRDKFQTFLYLADGEELPTIYFEDDNYWPIPKQAQYGFRKVWSDRSDEWVTPIIPSIFGSDDDFFARGNPFSPFSRRAALVAAKMRDGSVTSDGTQLIAPMIPTGRDKKFWWFRRRR